jgi:hypothetical protein
LNRGVSFQLAEWATDAKQPIEHRQLNIDRVGKLEAYPTRTTTA